MKRYLKPEMEISKFELTDSILVLESGATPEIGGGVFDGAVMDSAPIGSSWDEVLSDN